MSRVSVTTFFKENGLFKLLEHLEGEPSKSYKTKFQEFIMECTKCGQQVEQRGNSEFTCRRCRRSVSQGIDGDGNSVWVIAEPTGSAKATAEKAMLKPPKIILKPIVEEEEEKPDTPVAAKEEVKIPDDDDMLTFLKETAKTTSGERINKQREKRSKDEEENIDEPDSILPAVKKTSKQVPKPKDNAVAVEKSDCPPVKEVKMKVVELSPGQTFYCQVTGTLYMVKI